jgi:hypothetical protein
MAACFQLRKRRRSQTPARLPPGHLKTCPRFLPWHFEYKGQAAWRLCQAVRNLRSDVRAGDPRLRCRSAALDQVLHDQNHIIRRGQFHDSLAVSHRSQSIDQRRSQGIRHLRQSKISFRSFNSNVSTSFGLQFFSRLSACATYLSRIGSINKTFMT